jgi:hypothetical protein
MRALAVTALLAVAAAALAWGARTVIAVRGARRRQRQLAPPAGRAARQPGELAEPLRSAVLLHACGPCTGVRGASTCICAGNCGHPRCQGTAVACDLAGALQRITRGGRRG